MSETFGFCLDGLTVDQAIKVIKCVKEIIPEYNDFSITQDHVDDNFYTFRDIINNYFLEGKEIPLDLRVLVNFESFADNALEILNSEDHDKNDKKEARKISISMVIIFEKN